MRFVPRHCARTQRGSEPKLEQDGADTLWRCGGLAVALHGPLASA